MTKKELVKCIAGAAGITHGQADAALDRLVRAIVESEKISIPGLGTFQYRTQAARVAVNPGTGEKITVPEKVVLKFRAIKRG